MRLEINKRLQYNLIEETRIETLGSTLYQDQYLDLGRTVAVKCVTIEGQNRTEKQANYQKARTEVQAMIRIGEEAVNIPSIYFTHYDEATSRYYIVMEWIKGETLTVKKNYIPQQFLGWMIELCRILEKMEQKKLYHKDIKPDNIMICSNGKLYLIDFNISISTPNLIEGTLHYKAPEMDTHSQYTGREKVDMFSIGVMLYEFFTGSVPVRGIDYASSAMSTTQVWRRFIEPKDKNPDIPPVINAIVVKCMKLDPRQRYSRIGDLKRELERAVRELGRPKR